MDWSAPDALMSPRAYSQCTHEARGDISAEPESERPEDRCKED